MCTDHVWIAARFVGVWPRYHRAAAKARPNPGGGVTIDYNIYPPLVKLNLYTGCVHAEELARAGQGLQ